MFAILHAVRKRLWRLLRPRTRGVKAMLFSPAGELTLVRHTYGRSDLFMLPGGGVWPWETPEQAIRREISEELGCGLADAVLVSTYSTAAEGKRDTVYLFRATSIGTPRADGRELAEVMLFALSALPPNTSPATRRRIDEYLGLSAADGHW